jgi:hypothetical protein
MFKQNFALFDVSVKLVKGLPPPPSDDVVVPFLPAGVRASRWRGTEYHVVIIGEQLAVVRNGSCRTVMGGLEYEELRVDPHLERASWVGDFGLGILGELKKSASEHRVFDSQEAVLKSLFRISKDAYVAMLAASR